MYPCTYFHLFLGRMYDFKYLPLHCSLWIYTTNIIFGFGFNISFQFFPFYFLFCFWFQFLNGYTYRFIKSVSRPGLFTFILSLLFFFLNLQIKRVLTTQSWPSTHYFILAKLGFQSLEVPSQDAVSWPLSSSPLKWMRRCSSWHPLRSCFCSPLLQFKNIIYLYLQLLKYIYLYLT